MIVVRCFVPSEKKTGLLVLKDIKIPLTAMLTLHKRKFIPQSRTTTSKYCEILTDQKFKISFLFGEDTSLGDLHTTLEES